MNWIANNIVLPPTPLALEIGLIIHTLCILQCP
jgi:hypothetical protein